MKEKTLEWYFHDFLAVVFTSSGTGNVPLECFNQTVLASSERTEADLNVAEWFSHYR